MFSRKLIKFVAAGAAAVAVAIGGFAIGNSSSSNGASRTANTAHVGAPGQGPRFTGQSQAPQSGQVPQNWRPGTGTIITGAAADKAKAAAVAKYPGGTVNRVLKLSDGSYAVHRIGTPAPHHVFVNKDFKVTGTA
jgi:hypothetical protein